jgi:plasmid stabilization system protein ParE
LGERFADEVRRATEVLLEQPMIGALADSHIRKFILLRFPFTPYYSVTSDVLRIEVVAHQRRRPDYWQSRISR